MTKVKDSVVADCRYGEEVCELFGDYEIIEDKSEASWSGNAEIIATNGAEYIYLEYSYGSCSGCDEWDYLDLSCEQIKDEVEKLTLHMNKGEYEIWKSRKGEEIK